jgi:hypothetical protein
MPSPVGSPGPAGASTLPDPVAAARARVAAVVAERKQMESKAIELAEALEAAAAQAAAARADAEVTQRKQEAALDRVRTLEQQARDSPI